MRLKSLIACCLAVWTPFAGADQFQIISENTARAAASLLPVGTTIRHFCAPCGDVRYREEQLDAVQLRNVGDGFEVVGNATPLDLAYVYVTSEDSWQNLALMVGETPDDVPPFLDNVSGIVQDYTNAIFHGAIRDDLAVFVRLTRAGNALSGIYYYTHVGTPIDLLGSVGGGETFTLKEMVDGKETGVIQGTMRAGGTLLEGYWQGAGKDDQLPFKARMIAKEVSESTEGDIAGISTTAVLSYPMFLEGACPAAEPLTRFIAKEAQDARAGFMIDNVAGNVGDFVAEFGAPVWEYAFELQGFQLAHLSDKLASMSYGTYWYGGGAHGLYGTASVNLAIAGEEVKPLKVTDFVKGAEGLAAVSKLLLADLKRQNASSVVDGAITSFTEDDLRVFVVTPKGIRFFFNPYAVASYAEGDFEVFVKWDDLGDLGDRSRLE